eukprot:IDg6066t1
MCVGIGVSREDGERKLARAMLTCDESKISSEEASLQPERKPTTTVHERGANSISIRADAGARKRLTLYIAVGDDCSKLPFAIFKANPD